MFRTILLYLTVSLWFVAWAPLLLIALPSRWLSRKFLLIIAGGLVWLARKVAGIKYEIRYADTEDKFARVKNKTYHERADKKAIIAAKHMSILETAILAVRVNNVFFILKRELMWIPIYGWSFARIGLQPVNRKAGATNMGKLTDDVAKKIIGGMTLVIFPEGTRAKPGQKIKLRRGLLFIAESLKLPIQPVGTDTGLYWPKRGWVKPGTAHIWFEPQLPYNASLDEIAKAIQRHSA